MWVLYQFLFLIGFVCYLPHAIWRRRFPHPGWRMRLGEYPEAIRHRLGQHPTLWIHAVSVGEVLAAQPLIQALAQTYPKDPLVVSTITPGGFEVASKRLADVATILYFPLDLRGCVTRALNALRPKALILMESELWPLAIRLTHARKIPIIVVNGRMSPRSFRRAQWLKPWFLSLFNDIEQVLMQSEEDAGRLIQLGVSPKKVRVVGSLKWDASLTTRPDPKVITQLAAQIGLRTGEEVIVAGSTHRAEETAVLRAFQTALSVRQQVRLIIAPRHLERLVEVEGLVRQAGLTPTRLSQVTPGFSWDVGLVDTFGQLPSYYGLATLVFIGGSLIPHGGQNPLEAASLGKPIVFGPSMHNFAVIAHQLLAHHAARQISDAAELPAVFRDWLTDPARAEAVGRSARELTERFQGATQRTLEALRPFLAQAPDWPKGYA